MTTAKTLRRLLGAVLVLLLSSAALADNAWETTSGWWNASDIPAFDKSKITRQLPLIKVDGNRFVDEQGKTLVFRGVNISDPDKIDKDKRFSKKHFEVIRSWGANVVRVPVHPRAWKERGVKGYLELLDQVVAWNNELGIYTILSQRHGHGAISAATLLVTWAARRRSERY